MRKLATMIGVVAISGAVLSTQPAAADVHMNYPERPVTLRIPFGAGGPTDSDFRIFAKYAEETFGSRLIIQNVTGAGGIVSWNMVPNMDTDGYTLQVWNLPHILSMPRLVEDARFTKEDFAPIIQITEDPTVISVHADSEIETLDDLIEMAKERPGALTVGTAGRFLAHHLVVLMLEQQADINVTVIPFDGSAESMPALLSGEIDFLSDTLSDHVHTLGDRARVLAIASPERAEAYYPDVPTFSELGYEISLSSDRGIAAPSGTPQPIIDVIVDRFMEAANNPDFLAEMEAAGKLLNILGPDEVKEKWDRMDDDIARLIAELGLDE